MVSEADQLLQAQVAMVLGGSSAPLETLISHLMSPSNEQRSVAETVFNLAKQSGPDMLTMKLANLLQYSPHPEARAMTAILLRKLFKRDEAYLWPRISLSTLSCLRISMVSCIQREEVKSISNKICHTVCELALGILKENGWPELLPFLFQCLSSDSPKLQESAFLILEILSEYDGKTLIPHTKDLHSVFLRFLSGNSDVKIAALRAVVSFVQFMPNSRKRDRFQDVLPQMIRTLIEFLDNGNEATGRIALGLLIDLAGKEPLFFTHQLLDIVHLILRIVETYSLEESTHHLAIEFYVTLAESCERAPRMVKKLSQIIDRMFAVLMKMLEDIEDDPDWYIEEENNSETSMGQEYLDRLAFALGGKTIVPVAYRQFSKYLAASEWQKHHAALIALAQISEACSKY